MKIRITPLVKGLITAFIDAWYYTGHLLFKKPSIHDFNILYYILYAGELPGPCCIPSISCFHRKIRRYFAQGFRCFIVVTLVMVTLYFCIQ